MYTDTLLANGERIVRREHQHWFVLIWNARYAVAAVVLAIVLLLIGGALPGDGAGATARQFLGWATVALFVAGLIYAAWSYLRFQNEEYVITNRRIIHGEGVLNKRATDSSLEKINDAILTQSLFGRVFGFGDLDVLTASESGIERLRMLMDATDFKKSMLEAKHEHELDLNRPVMPPFRSGPAAGLEVDRSGEELTDPGRRPVGEPPPSPTVAPPPAPARSSVAAMTADDVTKTLADLADLRDRGAITPEEFDAKKADLLARL